MSIAARVEDDGVHVEIGGWDRVWALHGSSVIPWSEITGAAVVDAQTARRRLRWRLGGTGLPGVVLSGRFSVKDLPGVRELWATRRGRELLEITTTNPSHIRIVLDVDDPASDAAAINAKR